MQQLVMYLLLNHNFGSICYGESPKFDEILLSNYSLKNMFHF